jgi:CRISPR-associated protein (TIGR03984 family)
MEIDYKKIEQAFPEPTWAYAELFDGIRIGRWDGKSLVFYQPLKAEEEAFLQELRVFNAERELKFTGGKCRDTADYPTDGFVEELAEASYFLYGEHNTWRKGEKKAEGYTPLWEERGGTLFFPAKLNFRKNDDGEDIVSLKLGIKNYVRYREIPILPKDKPYDDGLDKNGAGGLEVIDYAYTGFYYADGKAVEE